ncbi:MAG: TrkH family potassium uptake protein [Anaerolineales bacterium]
MQHAEPNRLLPGSGRWLTPPKALVLGFAAIITIATLLLSLPIAAADGERLSLVDALFTATSALCVTGLTVVETGTRFSIFGQVVILLLLQVGGVGFITMAVVISVLIGRRVGLRERLLLQESLGYIKVQGMVRLALYILGVAVAAELVGFVLLWLRWQADLGPGQAAWFATFHSISAFVNAGFDLFGKFDQSSLEAYRGDVLVNVVVGGLILLGSLGLPVLDEIVHWKPGRRFSLHTMLVLSVSALLLVSGAVLLLITELEPHSALAQLPWGERLLVAVFHSVSARTGGFSTITLADLSAASWLAIMPLMFIGAATASMGGGMKTNVLGALLVTLWSVARGREQVIAFERTIPRETINKALAVMMGAVTLVMIMTILMTLSERQNALYLMFEVVSAFGTVGYSLGVTPHLSTVGKLLLVITMFIGRLGPLTLIAALARQQSTQLFQYPEEKILIG